MEELKAKQTGEARKSVIVGERKELPSIVLPLDAHIPEEYVPNLNTRLSLYHRLASVEHIEEVEDVAREIKDRFGPLPEPMENLLYIVKIKVLATRAEVSSISTQGKQIVIKPKETVIAVSRSPERGEGAAKQSLIKGYGSAIKIGATQIKLDTRLLGGKWTEVLEEILRST